MPKRLNDDKKANEERLKLFDRADNPVEKLETEPRTAFTEIGRDSFGNNLNYSLRRKLPIEGQYQNTSSLQWVDPKIAKGYPEEATLLFSGIRYSLAKSTLLRLLADASDAGITVGNMTVSFPFLPIGTSNSFNISLNVEIPAYFIENWVMAYTKGQLDTLYSGSYMSSASPKQNTKKEIAKVVAGQRAITLEEEV